MNQHKLLVELTRQFYEDCRHIAEGNATQSLDEEGCVMFNGLLREMVATFPECELLQNFRELPARSLKFKEAVVLGGQLYRIASLLSEEVGTGGASAGGAAAAGGNRTPTRETAGTRPRPATEDRSIAVGGRSGTIMTSLGGATAAVPAGRPAPVGPQQTPVGPNQTPARPTQTPMERAGQPGGAQARPAAPAQPARGGSAGPAAVPARQVPPPAGAPAPPKPAAPEKITQKLSGEVAGPARVDRYGVSFKDVE